MRRLFAFLALLAACAPQYDTGIDDNEIVFGIGVSTSPEGNAVTSAGWDIVTLAGRGSQFVALPDRSRSCVLEDLATRIGNPRVDHGIATWKGGKLPADGLAIYANQIDAPAIDGASWATGDTLTFQSTGFAAPDLGPLRITAASRELTVKTPAAGPLTVARDADLVVTWEPSSTNEKVLLALETDDHHQIRCFYDRSAGTGSIPKDLLAGLPAAAKGTFAVKTHTQVAGRAGGDAWTAYIVTTVEQRAQSFALDR